MSENFITTINENQCIGDSLDIINNNFQSLDTTFSSLSTLNYAVVAFTCERNGTGTQGQTMAHGSGSTDSGIVMPYSGVLLGATLHVRSITGTVNVRPNIALPPTYTNDVTYSAYELSFTDGTGFDKQIYSTPLPFIENSRLSWVQQQVPSGAISYSVIFFVQYIF